MSHQAYLKIIRTAKLPSPSNVGLQIVQAAGQDNTTLNDLVKLVEQDPATAGRILRYANSPLAGTSRKTSSLRQAVTLLGVHAVRSIALGVSVIDGSREGTCASFDYDLYWSESTARGATARQVAQLIGLILPDEAFTCGLLSQIGRLALATAFPETYSYVLANAPTNDPAALRAAERDAFDIDHDQLAAEMIADWGMPDLAVNAIRAQNDPDQLAGDDNAAVRQLAEILRLGGMVARIFIQGLSHQDELHDATVQATRAGVRPDRFAHVVDDAGVTWQMFGEMLNVKTQQVPPVAELYPRRW